MFSVVWGARTRAGGHKLEHRRFHQIHKETLFTVRLTEHWHKLPKVVVESPALGMFKSVAFRNIVQDSRCLC